MTGEGWVDDEEQGRKMKYDDTRVSRRGCGIAGYVAKEKVFVDGGMRKTEHESKLSGGHGHYFRV